MIEFERLKETFQKDVSACTTLPALEDIKRNYLGKNSEIKLAFKQLGQYSSEERKSIAEQINHLQSLFEEILSTKEKLLEQAFWNAKLSDEWIDLSLPGLMTQRGALHPVTQVEQMCLQILRTFGFKTVEGSLVEKSFYNFDALNIPEHHPARDLQDTFWLPNQYLLRSHTTSVQARILEAHEPLPIKVVSAGRVYRNEAVDATHLAMFHQLEGFWVDESVTFSDFKGLVTHVARAIYGQERRLRIKPKYYPYTEPSIGMDVECGGCMGKGCVACHDVGWITIIGAGMIHKNVLEGFGYDTNKVRGMAFGWGTTRMTSQLFNVKKIKDFYDTDLRFFDSINGK